MQPDTPTPPVPPHMVPILDRVLTGEAPPEKAVTQLGVTESALGILLRALIRQRAKEQQWDVSD